MFILKKGLILTGKILYERGYVDTHSGNISVRLPQGKDNYFLITRSGAKLGFLEMKDLVEVRGYPYPKRASSEAVVHHAIYQNTDWKAIIHTHSYYTVLLSFFYSKIEPLDSEGKFINQEVEVIDCGEITVGSKLVAERVPQYLKVKPLVVVKGHGVFCGEMDLDRALARIAALENSARLIYDINFVVRRGQ